MLPQETHQAIAWALTQTWTDGVDVYPVTKENQQSLVDEVREYFNANNIPYSTFGYNDLIPYL